MAEIQALYEQRANTHAEMRGILDAADAGNGRDLTAEENNRYNDLEAEYTRQTANIQRREAAAQRDNDMRRVEVPGTVSNPRGSGNGNPAEEDYRSAFRGYLTRSETADQNAILQTRAQSIGTNSAGGFLVPTTFRTELIETMKTFGTVLNLATVIETDGGNAVQWPTMDDTSNEGEQIAENATFASQDVTFGAKTLNAYNYSSKYIKVPYTLLQDSMAVSLSDAPGSGIENLVKDVAAERISRIMDRKFTAGVGTTEPMGLVTAATVGLTTGTIAAGVSFDNMIDIIHSVDLAYRNAGKFMLADTTAQVLRKVKDGQGRYLWQPSVLAGQPDMIWGYPVYTNNYVPAIGANAKAVIFGDMRRYYVRLVRQVVAQRLVERFADAGQIAFLVFMRGDANLMDSSAIAAIRIAAT